MFNDESQVDSLETESTEEVVEVVEETTEEAETPDWEAEAKKWKGIAERVQTKASKAAEPKQETNEQNHLSAADILAVAKSGIEPEDLDDVMDYAKFKGISIHEALKSTVIKATLADKAELRKSATATNTGSARRGSTGLSDDQLMANARKGVMPDSDEDIARIAKLRLKRG